MTFDETIEKIKLAHRLRGEAEKGGVRDCIDQWKDVREVIRSIFLGLEKSFEDESGVQVTHEAKDSSLTLSVGTSRKNLSILRYSVNLITCVLDVAEKIRGEEGHRHMKVSELTRETIEAQVSSFLGQALQVTGG
jgi:hypothetical protein